jgi:hypothetical protein
MKHTTFITESSWNYVVIFSRYNVTNEIIFITQKFRNISVNCSRKYIITYLRLHIPRLRIPVLLHIRLHCLDRNTVTLSTYLRVQPLVEARFSTPVHTGPGAHPASCTMGTGPFPGLKSGRGVTLTPHPLLVPRPWMKSYTSTPPMVRMACTEPQCLYKGALYPYFFIGYFVVLDGK